MGLPVIFVLWARIGMFGKFSIATPITKAQQCAAQLGRPQAVLLSSVRYAGFALCLIALAWWGGRRYLMTIDGITGNPVLRWVFNGFFILVAVQLVLAYLEREYFNFGWVSPRVAVLVPVYNEDPATLRIMLDALLGQSVVPDEIHIVDDGSTDVAMYDQLKADFTEKAAAAGIRISWTRTVNQGKRHAQVVAFRRITHADVFITVDSDSVLDHLAIEKLCRPFRDGEIYAVAGVILAWNNRTNLLSRITDLLFVTQQLPDRSAMSTLKSVLVNSGGLAAYRVDVLADNLDVYLGEKYLGRSVEFSDDSLLTLFALKMGKTVQQPGAFAFAIMPESFSHHYRQQVRWFRGSFIRGLWRVKFLSVFSWGFVRQLVGWMQIFTAAFVVTYFFAWRPIVQHEPPPVEAVIVPVLISYAQALRFMAVWRSDQSRLSQWFTFFLSPLMAMWQNLFLRPLRLWGMVSSRKMGWNTRQSVEVEMLPQER